jgi:apolipoprotein N-acyltransferase
MDATPYIIFAAVILLASLALLVQLLKQHKKCGRACVLYGLVLLCLLFLWSKHVVFNACYYQMVIEIVINVHFFSNT